MPAPYSNYQFQALIAQTIKQLVYLDNLDVILRFPQFSMGEPLDKLPTLSSLYLDGLFSGESRANSDDPAIVQIAFRACQVEDNTDSIEWQQFHQALRMAKRPSINGLPALGALNPQRVGVHLELRAMVYDLISLLSNGQPIAQLWAGAKAGDLDALLKLARSDKSILTTDPFAHLLRQKQFEADWEFFKKLGQSISQHPMPERAYKPKAVILTARFWKEEFQYWTHKDLVDFLVENDVLPNSVSGHRSFIRTINNLGLVKKRGRPKKRN